MKTCPDKMVQYMHEYLDEELPQEQETELKLHIQQCEACRIHFHELKKTIALVQSTSHISAPSNFTEGVMSRLPKEKKKIGIQRWFQRHPLIMAAAVFFLLMGGSLLTSWNNGSEFAFTAQPNVVVEGQTVIVPEGEIVSGDLLVRNGDLRVEGEVQGDVTLINGQRYMAGAGSITGDIDEIDQAFEWLWYSMKSSFKNMGQFFGLNESEE
ncbi:anti-sigma factor family protein [Jeotgalibacillus soli]|uniref:Anti-sigma-W factor RsiW n=1 Tax=Jeotgalibacillus soli TaxID=889306 RepID=A0A0C2W5C5_9BACL|nr:anti-sigma factor [Jeotgalibacillus soli]KIL51786.1 anti-sigma W factor [Jeotgalibacillus soli]